MDVGATDEFLKSDVIENCADGAIDVRPNRFEMAGAEFLAIVGKIAGIKAGKLNEGAAHVADHIADGDLARLPGQNITAFRPAFAANDIDPL